MKNFRMRRRFAGRRPAVFPRSGSVEESAAKTRADVLASPNGKVSSSDLQALEQAGNNYSAAAGHFRELFSAKGMIGFLFSFLQIPVLLVNSYILAIRFEAIFNSPGMALFTLNIMGWMREISEYDVFGLLVSLGIMGSAAAFAHTALHRRAASPLITYTSLPGWIALATFEIAVSLYGGIATDGHWINAALSALFAFGMVLLEGLFGIFAIDYFLVPLFLAVLWTLSLPFQLVSSGIRKLAAKWTASAPERAARRGFRRELRAQRKAQKSNNRVNPLAVLLLAVYQAVFQPLNKLDRFVSQKLTGGKKTQLKADSQKS